AAQSKEALYEVRRQRHERPLRRGADRRVRAEHQGLPVRADDARPLPGAADRYAGRLAEIFGSSVRVRRFREAGRVSVPTLGERFAKCPRLTLVVKSTASKRRPRRPPQRKPSKTSGNRGRKGAAGTGA